MQAKKILLSLFVAGLIGLVAAGPALAFPPLPSSFYGQVKVNGGNAPEGTLVRALINGQPYGEGRVQMYQGNSVYSLDVRGDESDTPERDGGGEGDTIQFEVGGVLAAQTGAWHTGTNAELNLTLASAGPLATPPPAIPPPPTQTPIAVGLLAPTPVVADAAPANSPSRTGLLVGLIVIGALVVGAASWVALRQRG